MKTENLSFNTNDEKNQNFQFASTNFHLVTGGCKNGKSSLAQKIAFDLAKKSGTRPIYFATMIPHDSEDKARIQKHREDRKNLGYETIECGKNISDFTEKITGRVVLFDSLTALVQNEMFDNRTDFENLQNEEEKISQKLQNELSNFMEKAFSIVFVSDTIYNDGKIYDKTSELYRRILAKTENFIAENCVVHEMSAGRKTENLSFQTTAEINQESYNEKFPPCNLHLIIGGAYQGKTEFAKKEFSLSDDEICICSCDFLPDFSKRCISHYENYVAFCLKNKLSPKTDFSDLAGKKEKIIICDDIFCGIVPVDSFQRKLREETGIALQKIAKNANVTRIFCGIAQQI